MTEPIRITYPQALALLKRAVKEKGADYVYSRDKKSGFCQYFASSGEASCIIGHALSYLGKTADDAKVGDWNCDGVESLVLKAGVTLTGAAYRLWDCAQSVQDDGRTWGDALSTAVYSCHRDGLVK